MKVWLLAFISFMIGVYAVWAILVFAPEYWREPWFPLLLIVDVLVIAIAFPLARAAAKKL